MSQSISEAGRYFMLRWEVLDGYCAIFKIPNGMREIHKPAVGVRMGSAFPDGQRFQMAKEEKGLKIGDVCAAPHDLRHIAENGLSTRPARAAGFRPEGPDEPPLRARTGAAR